MPEDLEDESLSGVEEGPARFAGTVVWGGVDSKYFATLVVPAEPFAACEVRASEDGAYLLGTLSTAPVTLAPGKAQKYDLGLYMGAKQLEHLQVFRAGASGAVNLSDAIDWGWFGSLSEVLGRVLLSLMRWFYDLTGIWGVAILLLTVVVKLVTLPLTLKQIGSMKRMKEIQPEIKKIKEKYGDDKVKQGQEMQALFARSGVNPLAGCLPMLVQFPIWIALYSMLSTAVDLVHEPFLWLPDLTKQDPYYITPLGLGVLMVLQQRITPQATMDPAQAKMMMWVMPTMFTFFMLFLPSGLAVYIFTNILLSLIQTVVQVGSTKKGEEPAS
jgi:YidC/Oxa1 family membrane protein insertase